LPKPTVLTQNNIIFAYQSMVWVGRDLMDHLVPIPLPWAGTPSTRPRCSPPHPAWPWTLPGRERKTIPQRMQELILSSPYTHHHCERQNLACPVHVSAGANNNSHLQSFQTLTFQT